MFQASTVSRVSTDFLPGTPQLEAENHQFWKGDSFENQDLMATALLPGNHHFLGFKIRYFSGV